MAILVDNTQLLLCSIKLEVILTLKVIVSFFSYNTQRRNLEELLQVSRDKVASGFTDEIKGTSCLQNKLLELQVSQPSSFKNIFHALIVIFSCRALTFYALCVLPRDTEHPYKQVYWKQREIEGLTFSTTKFLFRSEVLPVLLKEEIGGYRFVIGKI